jgi:hypothetical protein
MNRLKNLALAVGAAALIAPLAGAGAAEAAGPTGGCTPTDVAATGGLRTSGEICTSWGLTSPWILWYGDEGSRETVLTLGIVVTHGGQSTTEWHAPQTVARDGGVIGGAWDTAPFVDGSCYQGLVKDSSGRVVAAPVLCYPAAG